MFLRWYQNKSRQNFRGTIIPNEKEWQNYLTPLPLGKAFEALTSLASKRRDSEKQMWAAILKRIVKKGWGICSFKDLKMSQQGAALQTYNNELVKCKFVLVLGCFMTKIIENQKCFEERFPNWSFI